MHFEISTDKARLDPSVIHAFLTESYWAKGVPLANVKRRIANSLCFGAYAADGQQVGFARIISDFESFVYLADVFVLEKYRGLGLSKKLMQAVVAHPDLQGLRRIVLATRDAHGLYAQFGFQQLENTERWMEKTNLTVYKNTKSLKMQLILATNNPHKIQEFAPLSISANSWILCGLFVAKMSCIFKLFVFL